ncbi:MAG: GrpB family protein [Aureliella sp.]
MAQSFRLMAYNPSWPQEYEQTRSSILQATEGWVVDTAHIGGTGIVGATSRPVIDVMIGVSDLQALNEVANLVEGLNFRREATPEWCDGELCAFLIKPRNAEATHTVLAVRHDGELWNQTKTLQSKLVEVEVLADELQQAKLDNYKADCNAEKRYEVAKTAYYEELVSRLAGS